MAEKLTDKLVRALAPAHRSNKITYDDTVRGFGIRVTAAGAKSFVLNYRAKGRERRYTIGSYPDWAVAAAREEARRLKRDINLGHDPMGARHADRAAPMMADLAARYLAEHAIRKVERARQDDRAMLEKLVLPDIGKMKVAGVRHEDIERLHRQVSLTRPIRANRMAQLLSRLFTLAIKWEYRLDNPVKGLHRNPESGRTRYLSAEELRRLLEALGNHPNQNCANVIRLLLLTGARRGEVLNATWDQFDLAAGIWVKPSSHTKQKKEHRVPLSAAAIQLLTQLRNEGKDGLFLFPSKTGLQPLSDIKRFWIAICRDADLEDFRIHDLRHTYASILASAGLSLPVIGALLGHTQPNTTARYSHLFDDPLREATERVASAVNATMKDTAEIVSLPTRDRS